MSRLTHCSRALIVRSHDHAINTSMTVRRHEERRIQPMCSDSFLLDRGVNQSNWVQVSQITTSRLNFDGKKEPPKVTGKGGSDKRTKEQIQADTNNVDFIYKFDEQVATQFQDVTAASKFNDHFLQFLQDDVETKVSMGADNALVRMKILPESKKLVGKTQFTKQVQTALNAMKLLHSDVDLKLVYSEPQANELNLRARILLRGVQRLGLSSTPVHYNFLLRFHFSKQTKQVFLVELTDKTARSVTQTGGVLSKLSLAAAGLGLTPDWDSINISSMDMDPEHKNMHLDAMLDAL